MEFRKLLLLVICFMLLSFSNVQAQTPNSNTLKLRNGSLYGAVIKLKDGGEEEGFMAYHFPYSPSEEVTLVPLDGNMKNKATYKIKYVESIDYADLRYVQIFPDNDRMEYLAREAAVGELNLYTFTELNKAPAIIPVAGVIRAISIPYEQSLFFIEKGANIKKIDRAKYQKELLEFVGNNTELAQKIKNKTYKYKDIEAIVKEYNASVLKP